MAMREVEAWRRNAKVIAAFMQDSAMHPAGRALGMNAGVTYQQPLPLIRPTMSGGQVRTSGDYYERA